MKNLIKFMVFVMVFTMSLGVMTPTSAADIAINLGVGSTVDVFDNTLPVTDQSSAELALTTASDIYLQYDASANFNSGDTVTIVASTPLTVATTCATVTTDADGDGTPDGSGVMSGDIYTYTFTASTTLATTSVAFCLAVSSVATAGNYSFIVGDSNGDSGGALLYVGDANDVTVTASVTGEELEFRIRNAADSADTNSCALGTLVTTAVSTCNYALKVRTTATNGYTISWTSDGDLGTGTASIDAVAQNTAVISGAENYGVEFLPGTNTNGGSCTGQGIWGGSPDDPVSTIAQNLVSCTNANLPAASAATAYVHVMDHKASVSAATPAGSYQQIVTYYVTADF